VVFFERDVPYYAQHRDLHELAPGALVLYQDWQHVIPTARRHLQDADAGMVTSYCPDGVPASELLLGSSTPLRVFYDLDTPVTLGELAKGRPVSYLGEAGLRDFDLVLSYTGGAALDQLQSRLGARRVAPLYGSVDPEIHHPVAPVEKCRCELSYLGTYAEDRQEALDRFFLEPARRMPDRRFLIGGAQYPATFPWLANLFFLRHRRPAEHPAFFSSSRMTLNITRQAMAQMGYCPSGRLFEAAACGTPIVSDDWMGLDSFYEPEREIVVAQTTEDVIQALQQSDHELRAMADAARQRTLDQYTSDRRAAELEENLAQAMSGSCPAMPTTEGRI
jgi:spore maturation protein CgeB